MKKSFLAIALLLMSLTSFAKPIPKAELARINGFFKQIQKQTLGVSFKVISAEVSESSDLLTDVALQIAAKDFKISLSMGLEGDAIKLTASAEGKNHSGVSAEEAIAVLRESFQKAVNELNGNGDYDSALSTSDSYVGLVLTPSDSNSQPSVRRFEMKFEISKVKRVNFARFSVNGILNSSAESVSLGQVALTNIFKALANKEEPSQTDLQTLEQIFSAASANLPQ